MVRGGNNKRAPTSAVKAEARRNPTPSMRPKAKAKVIVDERPSQFRKGRPKAPEWLASKTDITHEKIPGTRIQCAKGGWPVRVVIADGKEFPADKVAAAKKHLRKLAQQEQEKLEIEHIINGNSAAAAAKAEMLGGAAAAVAAAAARKGKRKAAVEAEVDAKGGKKAKKEEAWRQRQQKLAQSHAAAVQEAGRQLASEEWHVGEVVQRTVGRAWLRPRCSESLPSGVLEKARASSEAVRHEFSLTGDLLPALFGDVVEPGLSLQPGVTVRFKAYTDRNGAGACEISAAEGGTEPPSDKLVAKGEDSSTRPAQEAVAPKAEEAKEGGEATQASEGRTVAAMEPNAEGGGGELAASTAASAA